MKFLIQFPFNRLFYSGLNIPFCCPLPLNFPILFHMTFHRNAELVELFENDLDVSIDNTVTLPTTITSTDHQ
jgi:hypothetical protein